MKVILLGFAKIKYMPYINFYLDNICARDNEVHVVYWNRDLGEEKVDKWEKVIFHEFKSLQQDQAIKLTKLGNFVRYRKFVIDILKKESFDFVIVLHTFPGVLLCDVLKRKYKEKFIFDYRDSSYEDNKAFKKIISLLVDASKITFTSSDGFRKYLPRKASKKILTTHNLLIESFNKTKYEKPTGIDRRIKISFWGLIRDEKINKEIIKKISRDNRFELHYYGREQQTALNLKAYSKAIDAKNIYFHGEYKPTDRYLFANNTDLIHNIYEEKNMMLAVSNKYYDGISFHIPQLCIKDSYMGKLAKESGVGEVVDPYEETFTEKIFDYVTLINSKNFVANCDLELERVMKEYMSNVEIISNLGKDI